MEVLQAVQQGRFPVARHREGWKTRPLGFERNINLAVIGGFHEASGM